MLRFIADFRAGSVVMSSCTVLRSLSRRGMVTRSRRPTGTGARLVFGRRSVYYEWTITAAGLEASE